LICKSTHVGEIARPFLPRTKQKAASRRPLVIPTAVIGLRDRLRLPLPSPGERPNPPIRYVR